MISVGSPWYFYIGYFFPPLLVLGHYLGGFWHFLLVMAAFVGVPLSEFVFGDDGYNIKGKNGNQKFVHHEDDLRFQMAPKLWILMHYTCVIVPSIWLANLESSLRSGSSDTSMIDAFATWAGLSLSVGVINGASFVVSHELSHSLQVFDRFLAGALLATSGYIHFMIEHVHGHHKRVATPEDPASGRLGESVYAFFPRTIIGSYQHAWVIENERLALEKKPPFSIHNRMIWFSLVPLVLLALEFFTFGKLATAFYITQSLIGMFIFEIINYVEHYGLVRNKKANGEYEKVNYMHSWNSNTSLTNAILLKIQRHSDHHVNALKAYQTLVHDPDTPQLPYGYAPMVILSLIPSVWFNIMNPRAKRANELSAQKFKQTQQ